MKWKINTIIDGKPVRNGEVVIENENTLTYIKANPDSVEKYKKKKPEEGDS